MRVAVTSKDKSRSAPRALPAAFATALVAMGLVVLVSVLAIPQPAAAQTSDLVNRASLRVCADPANMPFSNDKGEGFENKIADLLAADLAIPLEYTWFPQATGFIRQTLRARKCDIVMGYSLGHELVLNTNPYYLSTYVMVFRKGGALKGLKALDDPRLKTAKIGLIAGTPPATVLALNGLIGRVVPYHLVVDRRHESPNEQMIEALEDDTIQLALMWGPIGGWLAGRSAADLEVLPVPAPPGAPRMQFRITFGVRHTEVTWKHDLNRFIEENQPAINRILAGYGVPLLDDHGQLITP